MYRLGVWWIYLVLWLSNLVANVKLDKFNDGIFRGNSVPEGSAKWPFMAALLTLNETTGDWYPFCGGSVLNEDTILTAAHCLTNMNPKDVLVYLGNENIRKLGQNRNQFDIGTEFVVHPKYQPPPALQNDIAVVKLKWLIKFENYPNIKKVCLPAINEELTTAQSDCFVMGWGLNERKVLNDILHDLPVPVLSEYTCYKYQHKQVKYIPEMMLCAGYFKGERDACVGDSGGPLVCPHQNNNSLYVQYGIVSYGYGCALRKNPGFYTKVTNYLDWIQKLAKSHHGELRDE